PGDVEAAFPGRAPELVEPSSPGGIRLDKLYFLLEVGIGPFETAGEGSVEIGDGLESFDPADRLPGLDGRARLDLEAHLHGFSQHPGRELGESHPPEVAFLPADPRVSRRVEAVREQPRREPRTLVMDFLGRH